MKLNVRSELIYDFQPDTEVILSVQAAASTDQTILTDSINISSHGSLILDGPDANGERRVRTTLSGETTIIYEGLIDNGLRIGLPSGARQAAWSELPANVIQYLLPSRYCPADKFVPFAMREFGHLQDGERVLAILDWIARHVDYKPGVSNSETDAERTFLDRAGVCRDFTHLGITLCRALNIPARAVSAYALDLDPPDFHAIFEVYMNGGWWMMDATRLAPIDGLVRIGVGRDAADIAFLTTSLSCKPGSVTVTVSKADAPAPTMQPDFTAKAA